MRNRSLLYYKTNKQQTNEQKQLKNNKKTQTNNLFLSKAYTLYPVLYFVTGNAKILKLVM